MMKTRRFPVRIIGNLLAYERSPGVGIKVLPRNRIMHDADLADFVRVIML